MKWSTMSDKTLTSVLRIAVENSDEILQNCFYEPQKKIRKTVEKMEREIEFLETAADKVSAICSSNARELLYELYGLYRVSLQGLVAKTQWPFDAELLLDGEIAEKETIALLDHKVDGIFVFADGEKIRLRVPPLPHKNKPQFCQNGRQGSGKTTTTYIYAEAVYRVLEEKAKELLPLREKLGKKCIHILNVFEDNVNTMDNDNRDTSAIINSICGFLPFGDVPFKTRIINDGYISRDLIPGTYITVLPYEDGLADNDKTVAFWIEKLKTIGYEPGEVGS